MVNKRQDQDGDEGRTMNANSNTTAREAITICGICQLIPLSALSLELAEPIVGWTAALTERGVEILSDDLDRPAISRSDAQALIAKRREQEQARAEEHAKAGAAGAAPVVGGIPAGEGLSAYETLMT